MSDWNRGLINPNQSCCGDGMFGPSNLRFLGKGMDSVTWSQKRIRVPHSGTKLTESLVFMHGIGIPTCLRFGAILSRFRAACRR